jgi:molybdopterin-guanine dinucleotide biosynthesis protein
MVRRAVEVLKPVCGEVVVVGSDPALGRVAGVETLTDVVSDAGPLGGLHAGLLAARDRGADAVVLLGCDMPLVPSELVARVAEEEPVRVAAPRRAGGGVHPLCAVYPVTVLDVVERRLAGADRSLAGLLEELGATEVDPEGLPEEVDPEAILGSVNTLEELRDAERLAVRLAAAGVQVSAPDPAPSAPDPAPSAPTPRAAAVVCVIGYKDSGKTTVATRLVAELKSRGHAVAAVKHGHKFRLDTPGTDSWRLRHDGGADPVLLAGPEGFALMGSWKGEEPGLEGLLGLLPGRFRIVVAEGFKHSSFPKIEVFRSDLHAEPFLRSGKPGSEGIIVLVTDDGSMEAPVPVLDLEAEDLPVKLADLLEGRVLAPEGS